MLDVAVHADRGVSKERVGPVDAQSAKSRIADDRRRPNRRQPEGEVPFPAVPPPRAAVGPVVVVAEHLPGRLVVGRLQQLLVEGHARHAPRLRKRLHPADAVDDSVFGPASPRVKVNGNDHIHLTEVIQRDVAVSRPILRVALHAGPLEAVVVLAAQVAAVGNHAPGVLVFPAVQDVFCRVLRVVLDDDSAPLGKPSSEGFEPGQRERQDAGNVAGHAHKADFLLPGRLVAGRHHRAEQVGKLFVHRQDGIR